MSELGNRVRAARAYAGDMTQKELAAKLPFSLATLQRTEAGGRVLGELEERPFAEAVAKATGLPAWFFTEDFDQLRPAETQRDDADERVERRLQKLQQQVTAFQKTAEAERSKQTRSAAHDRGRLRQIEENLERLLVLLVEDNRRENP